MSCLELIKRARSYKGDLVPIFKIFLRHKIKRFRSYGLSEEHRSPRLIVSLTSYPERLKDIEYTIFSLLNQLLKPDKVILWLDKTKYSEQTLPKNVSQFVKNGLEIKFCEDLKSYTKLFPAIKEYPEDIIITADDDIYYPEEWLEKLYLSYLEHPEDIHCHRAHGVILDENNTITPYETWKKNIKGETVSTLNFLTGAGGVLYPPNSFDKDGIDHNLSKILCPTADDVWFWLMAVKNNKKIRTVKNNCDRLLSVNWLEQSGIFKNYKTLYSINRNGKNDDQIKSVLAHYPEIKNKLIRDRRLRMLFDVSVLGANSMKNGHRAGVYNVGYNILKELISFNEFELCFYSDYKNYLFVKELMKQKKEFSDFKLITQQNLLNKLFGTIIYICGKYLPSYYRVLIVLSRIYDTMFYQKCKKTEKDISYYDVYFSPFTSPTEEIYTNKKIKRYRMLHDIIPIIENRNRKQQKWHWYYPIYSKINSNDYYFTNSEYTREDFLKHFPIINPNKITTAQLGANDCFKQITDDIKISAIKQKYKIPENKHYILSLCTIGKRKNILFAVKSYVNFIKKYNPEDICFVVAGGKWRKIENELNSVLKPLKQTKAEIIQTGYIEDEDLPYLYNGADMLVYPSLYEGFGLPVLESMKSGCAVIASNVTSIPEVLGDAGILIDINEKNASEQFINAITKLYFDEEFKTAIIRKGLKRAELFSWSKCTRIITEKIKQTCLC